MKRVVTEGKVMFEFEEEDYPLKEEFEAALSNESHAKSFIQYLIDKAKEKTEELDRQWARCKVLIKESFPNDWPRNPETELKVTYLHHRKAFMVKTLESGKSYSSGKKK